MTTDGNESQPTPLYQALQNAALDAYGSLLSAPLADKAATAFADEASAMLEGLIAEHSATLRERIEAQLAGMTLGKGGKRKPIKAPAVPSIPAASAPATNGAAKADDGAKADASRSAKTADTRAAKPRKRGQVRPNGRA